jgi:hypothetical protein
LLGSAGASPAALRAMVTPVPSKKSLPKRTILFPRKARSFTRPIFERKGVTT